MILSQVDLGLIVTFVLYWYVYLFLLGERKSCMTSVCMHILGIFYTHIQRNIYFSFRQLSPIGTNARSYSKLKITPFNGYILIVIGLFEQRKSSHWKFREWSRYIKKSCSKTGRFWYRIYQQMNLFWWTTCMKWTLWPLMRWKLSRLKAQCATKWSNFWKFFNARAQRLSINS